MSSPVLGNLFVISAPSGAGKTSLVKAVLASMPNTAFSVSHTTRQQRPGEQPGVDYHFVSKDEFEKAIVAGQFLEHAQVFGNYYGTGREAVSEQLRQGHDVILEIDWQGAQQIRATMPQCHSIFILPPSRPELERRLRGRGQDDDAVIARRLSGAVNEIKHYEEFDYLVINDDFDSALAQLTAIIVSSRCRLSAQRLRYPELIANLLA